MAWLSRLLLAGMVAQSFAAPTHLAECHNHCSKQHCGADLLQPLHDGLRPFDKEAEAPFQKRYCFAEICQGLYCILCCNFCCRADGLQTQPTEPITEVSSLLMDPEGLACLLLSSLNKYCLLHMPFSWPRRCNRLQHSRFRTTLRPTVTALPRLSPEYCPFQATSKSFEEPVHPRSFVSRGVKL